MKLTHFALTGLFLLLAAGMYLTMKTDMDGRMEEMKADADRKYELLQKAIKEGQQQPALADAKEKVTSGLNEVKEKANAVAADLTAQAGEAANAVKDTVKGDPSVAEALNQVKDSVKGQADKVGAAVADAGKAVADAPPQLADSDAAKLLQQEQDLIANAGVAADRIADDTAAIAGAEPDAVRMTKLQTLVLNQPAIARIKENKEAAGFVVLDRGAAAGFRKGDNFAVRRGTAIIGRVTLTDTILDTEAVADVDPGKLVTGMVLQRGDELIKFNN